MKMYLVHHFDQFEYEFVMSLHSTRAAAEAAYADLLQRFVLKEGEPLPPKDKWNSGELYNVNTGEGVQLYEIECDGGPAEQISIVPDRHKEQDTAQPQAQ